MESISKEKKEAFLNALDQTQQKQAANFLRGNGERVAEFGDDCTKSNILQTNRKKLIELTDRMNGLLDEMLTAECISNRQNIQ